MDSLLFLKCLLLHTGDTLLSYGLSDRTGSLVIVFLLFCFTGSSMIFCSQGKRLVASSLFVLL